MYVYAYIYIYVCLCEWARDVHRKHDGATVPKFSDWLINKKGHFLSSKKKSIEFKIEFFKEISLLIEENRIRTGKPCFLQFFLYISIKRLLL